jgi:dTDP-4-dehydrorhamnose reductase
MKKILLTGGNGFFASRFNAYYKDMFEIISADKSVLDIRDEQKAINLIKDIKPDYVIHAAAIAATELCNNHPDLAYDINVKGALNVAKGCELANSKLVFLSSEQVFNGNIESGPYTEEHVPVPNTVYGQNKLEAEQKLKNILHDLWIIRFTWLFGLPEKGLSINANIIWNTLQTILRGEVEKVPVNEYRGMAYVYDVIEKFHKIFEIPYGTYHVGSENNLNRYETVCLILKEMGLSSRIHEIVKEDREKYKDKTRDLRLNLSKIKKLGINFLNTEEGIKKCLQDFNLHAI